MSDVFENIFGQPQVREFLRATISRASISHAYLFTGPAGSNKTAAAYAFAQSIICLDDGCMTCDSCKRIARRRHPDVHYFAPEGAGGYLVDQIRDITTDASLAPIQASRKVYIIDRVDLLGTQAANAFLKTLEEPPNNVVFILLGRTRESVLPTIVSRCQVVPFRHIPSHEAAGILSQNTGASTELARIAIEASGGSITKAAQFLKSNERMVLRARILEIMFSLELADDWDILTYAQDLVVKAKAPLDVVRATQEAEIEETAEYLSKTALRQIEARNKRALTAQSMESLHQTVAIISSWLRDVLTACADSSGLIINDDIKDEIIEASYKTDEARVAAALETARRCDSAIAYNVSPETCLDVLLLEIREVLYGSRSASKAAI